MLSVPLLARMALGPQTPASFPGGALERGRELKKLRRGATDALDNEFWEFGEREMVGPVKLRK